MGKKVFINSEDAQQFGHALDLLNKSISEFNQVADKMVPERLLTDGLIGYLKDFCKLLEEESDIRFVFSGMEESLNAGESIEIDLFRSIRTILLILVRNSRTNKIILHLIKKPELFHLSIRDNGVNIFRHPPFIVQQGIENAKAILVSIGGTLTIPDYNGNNVEIEVPMKF